MKQRNQGRLAAWLLLCANIATAGHVNLQILGSGGPELDGQRAGSSYLIWVDDKARLLIDTGPGSQLRFAQAKARFEDLDAVLFSHFHVDHSADLPSFIKAGYFTERQRDLPVYGPYGNHLMPDTEQFMARLFGTSGAFAYLNDYLDGNSASAYHLRPYTIDKAMTVTIAPDIRATAWPVHHGPIPALAWRLKIDDCTMTFTGDTSDREHTLAELAKDSDLLIAHHAIPEAASGTARHLHMPPSVIGQIAAEAKVKHLLLSHLMRRSLRAKAESLPLILAHYQGPVTWADDTLLLPCQAATPR
ncbi:MAG: MBL fold metallo-hydrolase [Methylococcales bacterium]|nr:MBL fold metallo-hydrolase [Methylococcales bacterium]